MGLNFLVNKIVIKKRLKYHGKILLAYRIEYPEFKSSCYHQCLFVVNQFYKNKALEFQKHCETELFRMAIEQYNDDVENNFPIRKFDAVLEYKVTFCSSCIISIYFDQYEYTGGAHGNTIRDSNTWNLQECKMIKLRQLIFCISNFKTYIFNTIESKISKDPELFFENYRDLVEKNFNENNFYCRSEGIVVFYQQYDIAPYSSGIMEFLIPYTSCVINPKRLY